VTAPERSKPAGLTRQDVFAVLGSLGAIITLVTAMMFYFGWRRSDAQSKAMGIDVSLFGFSPQDYVLRSISSLFLPLLAVFGLVLGWVWVHGRVNGLVQAEQATTADRRRRTLVATRWGAVGTTAMAAAALVFAVLAGQRTRPWPVGPLSRRLADHEWIVPCLLVVGTLLASYLLWMRRQLAPPASRPEPNGSHAVLAAVLVGAIVVLGAVWMLEDYAGTVGQRDAQQIAATVSRLPRAIVISRTSLGIRADNVREESFDSGDGGQRYRTTGLRLLGRSAGKMLLLHDGWTARTGTVIVLPDSDEFVWQFSR
jgi:hypothetical protein